MYNFPSKQYNDVQLEVVCQQFRAIAQKAISGGQVLHVVLKPADPAYNLPISRELYEEADQLLSVCRAPDGTDGEVVLNVIKSRDGEFDVLSGKVVDNRNGK